MYLGNPALPVSFPARQALKKVKSKIEEKNWQNFDIGSMKLVLVPFFFYQYHYFIEEEKNSTKIVKETVDGYTSLNAHSIRINENTAKLIKDNLGKEHTNAPDIEFTQQEINLSKKDKDDVILIKTAEYFKIPKENFIISDIRTFFVPFYETQITIDKNTYSIVMNAVDGNIIGIKEVPEREKGFLEITNETLDELTEPSNWVKYSKELFEEVLGAFSSSEAVEKEKKELVNLPNFSFLTSKWVLIIIMILALMLIYLAFI
jgi:hypothetical protein